MLLPMGLNGLTPLAYSHFYVLPYMRTEALRGSSPGVPDRQCKPLA